MKTRFLLTVALAFCLVSALSAQTKSSGTMNCAKADPMHMVEIGDKPGHAMMVAKNACKWTTAMDIGGSPGKEGTSTATSEMNGAKSSDNGVHWGTTESGDKYFVKYWGTSTSTKEGNLDAASGSWKYTGGTGKLKGLTGKGTFKGKGNADGTAIFEVEGDWSLPAAKAPAAKAPAKK